MTRLKVYRWMDIDIRSYQKPQEAQMISTMVEYLQGIQIAKEAIVQCKNRLGNLAIKYRYFTRANDTYMRYVIGTQIPYGGSIISHNTLTNNGLGSDTYMTWLRRLPRRHLSSLERFWSICINSFKIQNLYVKNITFAYSLPMSTSTWHSNYCNGPDGYMSGELKSENINTEKAPT
jgi:hypothetical protein